LSPLVTNFIRQTSADGPIPFLWKGTAKPDMIADQLPALYLSNAAENAESAIKPIVKTVGDFVGLVFGLVYRVDPICDRFRSINREVAVQLNHGVAGIHQIGSA
jgi:hypothetical protein